MNSVTFFVLGAIFQILAIIFGVAAFRQQFKESDKGKTEIMAHQDQSTDRILEALRQRNEKLRDKLKEKYPYGYVLLGGRSGDVVALPVYSGDLQVEANWSETEIRLDPRRKIAEVKIPQPVWKQTSGPQIHIEITEAAYWTGHYSFGEPVEIPLVKVAGQPNMYFEVVDDDQRDLVCIIGFKKG